MEKLRKIIRKKILEVLQTPFKIIDNDSILYNFERGRAFAKNKLANDIQGLSDYELIEYFPRGENEDSWLFEYNTPYGENKLVEIQHKTNSMDDSYWMLTFSVARKDSFETPEVIFQTDLVQNYESFIKVINQSYSKKIDTSKY